MNQEIIVYVILALTIGLIGYSYTRKKLTKKAHAGNTSCEKEGCTGCPLKDKCH